MCNKDGAQLYFYSKVFRQNDLTNSQISPAKNSYSFIIRHKVRIKLIYRLIFITKRLYEKPGILIVLKSLLHI